MVVATQETTPRHISLIMDVMTHAIFAEEQEQSVTHSQTAVIPPVIFVVQHVRLAHMHMMMNAMVSVIYVALSAVHTSMTTIAMIHAIFAVQHVRLMTTYMTINVTPTAIFVTRKERLATI